MKKNEGECDLKDVCDEQSFLRQLQAELHYAISFKRRVNATNTPEQNLQLLKNESTPLMKKFNIMSELAAQGQMDILVNYARHDASDKKIDIRERMVLILGAYDWIESLKYFIHDKAARVRIAVLRIYAKKGDIEHVEKFLKDIDSRIKTLAAGILIKNGKVGTVINHLATETDEYSKSIIQKMLPEDVKTTQPRKVVPWGKRK